MLRKCEYMTLLERFISYVKIDTQSDEESTTTPSTLKQFDLLTLLKKQLDEMGVKNELDQYGRLYAFVPGNENMNPIGVCSHVDTALECSGYDVKPQVIMHYELEDIKLGTSGLFLSPKEFPKLKELEGKTIITTDGTTLLGADDKAGVAIIMDVVERLSKLDKDMHAPMYILFTPDEEIGRGPEHFNTDKFACKFAYTIDGDDPKYVEIENFNAASMKVSVEGKSIHPGSAKGLMVNAILVLNYFMDQLPKEMIPAKTENREGFNHVTNISGSVEHAEAHYILRNHDKNKLDDQVQDFNKAKELTLKEYPEAKINLEYATQYRNMFEIIEKNPLCKIHIENVYKDLGLKLEYKPIRGGTDGATFSFKGVPCPNIGTGSYNHHGKFEFAVLEEMALLSNIVERIFTLK